MQTEDYLHGYTAEEQKRLREQSRILGESVFRRVSFPPGSRVLEVGCGVGAQTELLLERFPEIRVCSVDREEAQLAQARINLAGHPGASRVEFRKGDAKALPFKDGEFDGSFICWMLEHVPGPEAVLAEVKRCLKPGATVFLNEVYNQLHSIHPTTPEYERYWAAFNTLQAEMGGDPMIGLRLGILLHQLGFASIETEVNGEHADCRDPARLREIAGYWKDLLLSAAPSLVQRGRVTQGDADGMARAVDEAARHPSGAVFFGWIKARARRA
jgi:SAM-dependent methyltransferase